MSGRGTSATFQEVGEAVCFQSRSGSSRLAVAQLPPHRLSNWRLVVILSLSCAQMSRRRIVQTYLDRRLLQLAAFLIGSSGTDNAAFTPTWAIRSRFAGHPSVGLAPIYKNSWMQRVIELSRMSRMQSRIQEGGMAS